MSSKFRSRTWDPMLIVAQIIVLQFQFYSTLLICNYFFSKFVNITNMSSLSINYSLSQIFDHRLLNLNNAHNTFVCFSFLVNSAISAVFILHYVNRSKQCLDFTVTVFAYHILFSWMYVGSFPSSFMFWLLIVICSTIMTVLSECLCMKAALKEIPLSLVPKTNL